MEYVGDDGQIWTDDNDYTYPDVLLGAVQTVDHRGQPISLRPVGARPGVPAGVRPVAAQPYAQLPPPIQASRPAPSIQGGAPVGLRTFVGLGIETWEATEDDTRTFEIEPQRDFQTTGIVCDQTSSDGATFGLVDEFVIGDTPQSPTVEQAAPMSMFAHDSWGAAMLDFQNAKPGMKIILKAHPSGQPASGETFTAAVGLWGRALRG